MTAARHAAALLWPLVLLIAFLGTFRRTAGQPVRRDVAHACDRPIQGAGRGERAGGAGGAGGAGRAGGAGDSTSAASDIAVLDGCLAVDPTSIELMVPLALAYEADGSSDKAEAMYRRAIATDPRDGDLHARLGEILLRRGDYAGARAEADAALRWNPNSARATALAAESSR